MERTCEWIAQKSVGRLVAPPSERYRVVRGVSTDSRQIEVNQLYVPLVGERLDGHQFLPQAIEAGAAAALWQADHVLPAGIEIPLILVTNTLAALQQLAAAYRQELQLPVVAITGSNGKTTTKDILASILAVRYRVHKTEGNQNNHIGLPLTLLSISKQTEVVVVELGMNHAGEIALLSHIAKPDIAVITNIGEAHLQFLGSREGIASAKLEIREGLAVQGPIFYDGDEPLLAKHLASDAHPQVRVGWFAAAEEYPVEIEGNGFHGYRFHSGRRGTRFQLPLLGRHNVKNALLAIEVGRHLGLREDELQLGLAQVRLTGRRLEMFTASNGMRIINDCYNASPTSMRAGLDLLGEVEPHLQKWALLGSMYELGKGEEGIHNEIGAYAIQTGISQLYTIGEYGSWIADGARAVNTHPARVILHFSSPAEAVETLQQAGNEQVLLLVKASRAVQLWQVVEKLTEGG
jgi:UDP-N-acetylmuramoyl-tripeptide--D-alanyl-D-alanine ligase